MKIIGVIPARYNSSRFEGKPLADICGKPMIWWVYKQVEKVKELSDVIVATDDERISSVCRKYEIPHVMTSQKHKTSTERVHEVALKIKSDFYVCVNGDEPLINPNTIRAIIPKKNKNEGIYVANLMTKMTDPVEVVDNSNIKVVIDNDSFAMYMSRSPIPHPKSSLDFGYKKHLGVLIYNYDALEFFKNTTRKTVENIEDINELRFIENGIKLKMIYVDAKTLSVDTPKDLDKVVHVIKERISKGEKMNV